MGAKSDLLKSACDGLKTYYHGATDCENIIVRRANLIETISSFICRIPKARIVIVGSYSIISMWKTINKNLNIEISKTVLKEIYHMFEKCVRSILFDLIFGYNYFNSMALRCICESTFFVSTQFIITYIYGYLYVNFLINACRANVEINYLNNDEIKRIIKAVVDDTDFNDLKMEALWCNKRR